MGSSAVCPGCVRPSPALTPAETDRVAEVIRADTGLSANVGVVGVETHEVLANELLAADVAAQLEADDLGHWLGPVDAAVDAEIGVGG